MARGRGGIRTQRQYEALSSPTRGAFERQVEIADYAHTWEGRKSFREAFHDVTGRYPAGRDYALRDQLAGSVWHEGRLVSPGEDRLFREPMHVPTPAGIFFSGDLSWHQRSELGKYWNVLRNERAMNDAELERALRRFRRLTLPVYDEQLGRVVRRPLVIDAASARKLARSPDVRAEKIISPKLGGRST